MPFNKTEALRRAEEHLSKREITAAIAIHRMIAQADPYDLTTINALGELYVSTGRTKEAIEDFTRIAEGYLNSGSGIKAAYLLRKVLDLDPSNAVVLIKLGEIYLREGMIEKAHDEFIRAGALLAGEGQLTGALQANHRALTAKPGSPQASAAIALLQADSMASEAGPVGNQPETGTRGLRSPSESASVTTSRPLEAVNKSNADEESLILQLSKAEMLVGYGEVDRAIAFLKDVVNQSPDNLELHGKLKDIYLRNEMIKEAALECLELARIHEARGESARASEYTMRAGRLGQSSGHLINHPPAHAPAEVAIVANADEMPLKASGTETSEPKPPIEPMGKQGLEDIATPSLPTADPRIRHEGEPEPAVASPIVLPLPEARPDRLEVAPPLFVGPRHVVKGQIVAVKDNALKIGVSEAALVPVPPSGRELAPAERLAISNSTAPASSPGLLFGANTAPLNTGRRWLSIAVMSLVGAIALTLGSIKGVSMYGAQLDQQFEELTLSSSATTKDSPPGLPSSEDLQPGAEQEAVEIDLPPVQVVRPSGATEQPVAANQPASAELEGKSGPAVISDQSKINKPPAATPPMVAVTDQRGGESFVPRGLPTGAPQTFAPAPSPPQSAPQPAAPIVKGQAIRQAQPDYPAIARTARQEGTVPVEISINENGDVVSARAVSGPILLRGPAESAARRWKFTPSTRDGKPLPTVTTINFRFKL